MTTLATELEQTIGNLETLRDAKDLPEDDLLRTLDRLYEQRLALIGAAIDETSAAYREASASMGEAAAETQAAIDDLARLAQAIEKVGNAIGKVAKVVGQVV